MSALFERLQTLAFVKQDSERFQSTKSISHATSSRQIVGSSIFSNQSISGEPKKNITHAGHKQASLGIGGSISKKRISIEIRERERANLKFNPIKSVDDWPLNVKSRLTTPGSQDTTSSSVSWNTSEDHESSLDPSLITHEDSPSPFPGLGTLDEDNVVEIPGEWQEGGRKMKDLTDYYQLKGKSSWKCYCCLPPWTQRSDSERSYDSGEISMQTLTSIQTQTLSTTSSTNRSWNLKIINSSYSQSSSEKINFLIDSRLRLNTSKENSCLDMQFDEPSEIDALWKNNPHWVQPEDLCQISSLGVLGRGVEGGVTGVLHIPTCALHALKSTDHNSEIEKYLMLKELAGEKKTKQLMGLNGLFVDGRSNKVALVLDYMNLGSLHDHFTSCSNPCNEKQMKYIARETLLGLRTLHSFNTPVVHCDIKPNNILVSSGGQIRIGDYGLLQRLKSPNAKSESGSGTMKYFSPERHEGSFAMPADIWALGVTLVECLRGSLIEPRRLTNYQIASGKSPLYFLDHDEVSENVVDFLRHCLEPKPEKRWDVERLLLHPLCTTDFLHLEILFAAPKRNEALLKEILQILTAFIQKRVQQLGRTSSIVLSNAEHGWSDKVSHEDRLENIMSVTGYTKADVLKFVDDMYEQRLSIARQRIHSLPRSCR